MSRDNDGVTDQTLEESTDQPGVSKGTSDGVTREQPKSDSQQIEINGEMVDLDELKAGYLRQSDYTKKTQELADEKRLLARAKDYTPSKQVEESDDIKKAKEQLKALGVVTKDELDAFQKKVEAQSEDKQRLEALIAANPHLKDKRSAIETIGQVDKAAWEDIIVKYGFEQKDKLSKAKAFNLVGESTPKRKPGTKSLSEMSDTEYLEWKKQNNVTGKTSWVNRGL